MLSTGLLFHLEIASSAAGSLGKMLYCRFDSLVAAKSHCTGRRKGFEISTYLAVSRGKVIGC
eukprot:6211997-Pleurochrysis_carterae.AAC.2